jgi:hypothetical protein
LQFDGGGNIGFGRTCQAVIISPARSSKDIGSPVAEAGLFPFGRTRRPRLTAICSVPLLETPKFAGASFFPAAVPEARRHMHGASAATPGNHARPLLSDCLSGGQLAAFSFQLSAFSFQLSACSLQLAACSSQLSARSFQLAFAAKNTPKGPVNPGERLHLFLARRTTATQKTSPVADCSGGPFSVSILGKRHW